MARMKELSDIYADLHSHRFDLIFERRRARDYQARLADAERDIAEMSEACLEAVRAMGDMLEMIEKTADRYSAGSVTRVALDNLLIEIVERLA